MLVVHSDHRSEPDETEDVNSQQQKWVSPQMKLNDKQKIIYIKFQIKFFKKIFQCQQLQQYNTIMKKMSVVLDRYEEIILIMFLMVERAMVFQRDNDNDSHSICGIPLSIFSTRIQ